MKMVKLSKPSKVTATTKAELMNKIAPFAYTISSANRGASQVKAHKTFDSKHYRVYNLHKVRKKTKVLPNGQREIVRHGHWVGYVYNIPTQITDNVRAMKLVQNNRNFFLSIEI